MPNSSKMSDSKSTRGGTHEQHVQAGKQSHKNTVSKSTNESRSSQGGRDNH